MSLSVHQVVDTERKSTSMCRISLSDPIVWIVHGHDRGIHRLSMSVHIGGQRVTFVGDMSNDEFAQCRLAAGENVSVSIAVLEAHRARKPIMFNPQVELVYDEAYEDHSQLLKELSDANLELINEVKGLMDAVGLYDGPRFGNNAHIMLHRMSRCMNILRES